jgi:phenylacetate-coenzyme A ligase PaaK-like adenylate-forming protein
VTGLGKLWARGRSLCRLARHLPRFLEEPLTPDQAAAAIACGVEEREARFLERLRGSVYGNPRSPFYRLLEAAGCEYGDVVRLVGTEGLDEALRKLALAGVYLSFDEFKCRAPAVRGSRTFHFEPGDFPDPGFRGSRLRQTSGTTGPPMRFGASLELTSRWALHWCLFFAANGVLGAPLIFWTPGNAGNVSPQVACAKFRQRVDHWFVSQRMPHLVDRAYAGAKHAIARRYAGLPRPRLVAYQETAPVLTAAVELLQAAGKTCVETTPSAAVRLSLAAQEQGIDLGGLVFLLGAEPLTPARREAIEASGARATPLYGSTEAVWTGGQCPWPRQPDEVHVLRDLHAVIADPASEAGGESGPSRLLFTTLASGASTPILNTDIGDTGFVQYRRCDCLYDRLGCRQTIHTIRSADKLTGFGVTIWVADVQEVLESAMARRFQASATDLQLIETRAASGLPRYVLVADPRLAADNRSLLRAFLDELGRRKRHYAFMVSIWERERVIDVLRRPPLPAPSGKLLPFLRLPDPSVLASPERSLGGGGRPLR